MGNNQSVTENYSNKNNNEIVTVSVDGFELISVDKFKSAPRYREISDKYNWILDIDNGPIFIFPSAKIKELQVIINKLPTNESLWYELSELDRWLDRMFNNDYDEIMIDDDSDNDSDYKFIIDDSDIIDLMINGDGAVKGKDIHCYFITIDLDSLYITCWWYWNYGTDTAVPYIPPIRYLGSIGKKDNILSILESIGQQDREGKRFIDQFSDEKLFKSCSLTDNQPTVYNYICEDCEKNNSIRFV